jgi:ribonuclease HII
MPSFIEEELLAAQGYRLIAGVDEAGRGALAGPVVAAAVILPRDLDAPWLAGVKDSKLLTPNQREIFFGYIRQTAVAIGIGAAAHHLVDSWGIVKATRLAMKQAIEQLSPKPESLLIDYLRLPEVSMPQKGITNGDNLSFSIACASIIAKVARDRLMMLFDRAYPGYGLARHKGYGTSEHFACLSRLGPCPIHRRTFSPVKDIILYWRLSTRTPTR